MGRHNYGVILDAGSSGTRVYVYEWLKPAEAYTKYSANGEAERLEQLPHIKTNKDWRKKVHPGISTFGETPKLVGPDHLKELVDFALDIVPSEEVENTPVFLLATAGMRLLPEVQSTAVLENTCAYIQKATKFQLPDCGLHVQVIPGETEGLYGWIAANYLLRGFDQPDAHDHGKGHNTYGFLDMGGASAQIAFAPNATEALKHAEDLKLLRLRTVNGTPKEYRVFVTTWLGFGANEARRRYVKALGAQYNGQMELPDPCLPVGLVATLNGEQISPHSSAAKGKEPHLRGTGNFKECLTRTYPLLEKDRPCDDAPCLLNGQHTPAIDFDVNHFVGVSEYWHTTHEIFAMAHKDKAYDFLTYQKQVTKFCSTRWEQIEADLRNQKYGHKVDEKTVEEVCFKASWLINMLHDGIGIPREGLEPTKSSTGNKTNEVIGGAKDRGFLDPFQAVDTIGGQELSWTLGKMVLYASSQMPSHDSELPVGFGNNEPGVKVSSNWQPPGGGASKSILYDGSTSTDHVETVDDSTWQDRILSGSNSRRIPGILLFLVILALAVYLLCGKQRRGWWMQKLTNGNGGASPHRTRKLGLLSSSVFSRHSGPAYDRVMEQGEADELELADVSASNSDIDSHEPPRTGRTSGWATPANRGMSPDAVRSSPKGKGYFDQLGSGNALGITPFDRGGLLSRVETKDRMTPGPFLSTVRTGSPRRSPLMTPFKENVD